MRNLVYHWMSKKEVDFIQKQKAYQVSLTSVEEDAFAELKKEFKHIKDEEIITPENFDRFES